MSTIAKLMTFSLLLLAACHHYGPASPETCHAKHVRDGRGGPGAYDVCMAEYHRRVNGEQRPRRSIAPWILAGALVGSAVHQQAPAQAQRAPVQQQTCRQWSCTYYGMIDHADCRCVASY